MEYSHGINLASNYNTMNQVNILGTHRAVSISLYSFQYFIDTNIKKKKKNHSYFT